LESSLAVVRFKKPQKKSGNEEEDSESLESEDEETESEGEPSLDDDYKSSDRYQKRRLVSISSFNCGQCIFVKRK